MKLKLTFYMVDFLQYDRLDDIKRKISNDYANFFDQIKQQISNDSQKIKK